MKHQVQFDQLIVGDNKCYIPVNIINDWKEHFESLATPTDREVTYKTDTYLDLSKNDDQELILSTEEVRDY